MSEFILSALIGGLFVIAASLLTLGSYLAGRRLLDRGGSEDRTHDVASIVAFRIAALHGLILALVYAQELDAYRELRTSLAEEAAAISDVYHDIDRYRGAAVAPIQASLATYLAIVVDREWGQLGRGEGLSAEAWIEWDKAYNRLLDLTPATDRERYLATRMRDRITGIATLRQSREATAMNRSSGLFWAPALIGLVLLAIPLYVFPPTRTHILLISLFGAYAGVILFFIYSFANPFESPGKLEPIAFQHLLRGDIGKSLPRPPG